MSIQLPPAGLMPRQPNAAASGGWRRWIWSGCGLAVGVVVAGVVALMLPTVYQSSAQISIIKKRPDTVTGVDTRLLAEEYTTPPQDVLKSSLIIDRAIQSRGLDAMSLEVPEGKDLAEYIRDSMSVIPNKGPAGPAVVYRLHFRGRDAEKCRTVLSALLDTYREFIESKHQNVSKDTLELILREKQNLESEIAKTDSAYRSFRERAPLMGKGKDGLELRQERLTTIQAKRSALLLQKVELEGQLSSIETAQKEGRSQEVILAMVVDYVRKLDAADPAREKTVSFQDQLLPLLLEERKLIQIHGAKHPDVIEVRKRIETARKLMVLPTSAWKGELDPNLDPISLHLETLRQKLQHLQNSDKLLAEVFKNEQDDARRLAAFEIENEAFRARIALNQSMYESLSKRINEVGLVRNVGGYQIEMLEAPAIGKRVAPSMMLALAIGAAIGIGLGFGAACVVESRKDSR